MDAYDSGKDFRRKTIKEDLGLMDLEEQKQIAKELREHKKRLEGKHLTN